MTSVSEPSTGATLHLADVSGNTSPARGPRCHCGTPITHVPGKRVRVYCSDACRKAAKRAIAKAERTVSAKADTLGTESTEFRPPLRPAETSSEAKADTEPSRQATAKIRKARRYAGRRTLWRITGDKACKGCGRDLMDPASGVLVAQTADGSSVVLGLMKCARIWFCPVCSATIRQKRAEEITRAVVAWINQGGTAYLVSLTARHDYEDELADLMDAIQGTRKDESRGITRKPGAYQRLITGGAWAGDSRKASIAAQEGIRGRVGYIGMIRATEVTVGTVNLWHPHIHAIVFVGGRTEGVRSDKRIVEVFAPDEAALQEWEDHWRGVWTSHLQKVNPKYRPSDVCGIPDCKCDGKGHGVDFKRLETAKDAENLGEYIAKTQDGKSPALELARGDLKEARGENMTPFQVLYRIGDLTGGVPEEDAPGHGSLGWCLGLWHEYERAMTGRRAIEWTRYLRPLLGLTGGDTEEDDKDLAAEGDVDSEFRGGAQVTEEGWSAVARQALDLAVTEAAEGVDANTDPSALTARVREILALAGVEGEIRQLTSGEVAEAYEAKLEALAQRREEAAARRRREAEEPEEMTGDERTEKARRALGKRFA